VVESTYCTGVSPNQPEQGMFGSEAMTKGLLLLQNYNQVVNGIQ
jgi:hypothetical protein